MTRTTNARIAGLTLLVYIAAGVFSMMLFRQAAGGEGVPAKLVGIAHHPSEVGLVVLLGFVQCFAALVLAVTLHAVTREQDADLAMLALACRVGEGIIAGSSMSRTTALVWLATASGVNAPDTTAAHALGAYLLRGDMPIGGTFFAVGSTLFSYLLLRGRLIPIGLAWLGAVASIILVIGLPLQAAGFLGSPLTAIMWLPMLAFEVPLGLWFMTKGVRQPARAAQAA